MNKLIFPLCIDDIRCCSSYLCIKYKKCAVVSPAPPLPGTLIIFMKENPFLHESAKGVEL